MLEAIVEDAAVKQALFARIEPRLKPGALLASNTSSIPLETLAAGLADPGRVDHADALDAGLVLGAGFAPFRGGPLRDIEASGAAGLHERLTELHQSLGERFRPDAGWASACGGPSC